jgi:hypothetical protein
MKVVSVKKLEDCFDGSLISEVRFDKPITHEFIEFICAQASGKYQYFKEFARPFFKADFIDLFIIEGIQGALSARVVICRKNPDKELKLIAKLLKDYGY